MTNPERSPLPWRETMAAAILAVWLGGLVVYATIVVPIGAEALGGHEAFGFITRRVTSVLNHAVTGILAVILLHQLLPNAPRPGTRWRWATFTVMASCQIALYAQHPWLDELLDATNRTVIDRGAFYERHRVYLLTTTLQWVAGALHFRSLIR